MANAENATTENIRKNACLANQFDAGSNEIAARDGYRGGDNNGTDAESSAQRLYQAVAADAIEASTHRNAGV